MNDEISNSEESHDVFYSRFGFLTDKDMQHFMEIQQAEKRQRLEDEQIDDEKIAEKVALLEKCIQQNKKGP